MRSGNQNVPIAIQKKLVSHKYNKFLLELFCILKCFYVIDSPRLHLTTGNNKKRPADEVPNAKQKIIKLTVKPPSQHLNSPTSTSSSSNSKTQQYTPEEDKKHPSKKHKTI